MRAYSVLSQGSIHFSPLASLFSFGCCRWGAAHSRISSLRCRKLWSAKPSQDCLNVSTYEICWLLLSSTLLRCKSNSKVFYNTAIEATKLLLTIFRVFGQLIVNSCKKRKKCSNFSHRRQMALFGVKSIYNHNLKAFLKLWLSTSHK